MRKRCLFILLAYIVLSCAVCYFFAEADSEQQKIDLQRHCQVIASDVWNFDETGPVEYLTLAARFNHYEHLKIIAENNPNFLEIDNANPEKLEALLVRVGLVRPVAHESEILYDGQVIGTLQVIRRQHIIYTFAYVWLVSSLLCLVALFIVRLLDTNEALELSRKDLEKRVQERTADLENEVVERRCAQDETLAKSRELKTSYQQLKANELEREKLLNKLKAKNKELQSVVYIASHDLRSPLVNIQGFGSELNNDCQQILNILKDIDLDDELMQEIQTITEMIPESLGFISSSADKMSTLLDGLLRVSRVGTRAIDIQPLDMDKIASEVLQSMEFQIKQADVNVVIDPLPGCMGDEGMINQVFSNLMDNAIKYLDPNRKGLLRITGKVEGNQTIYCMQDNGIGIMPKHQSKIFDLFHRLTPNDLAGGEGIGLTIVTRILDRNNGTIRVESEPQKGSTFFVTLPNK